MKHNWEYKNFGSVADILYGCPYESDKFNTDGDGMPLIRIRDVKPGCTTTYYSGDYSTEFIIRRGEYLIGMDGEFNIAPWKSDDALLNQRVCRIKANSQNLTTSDFLYYFLGRALKRIEEQTSFVTVKHLSAKVLGNISTPTPPKKIQERIVAELDDINAMIEAKREQLKQLDLLAESVFYTMFGDPVANPKGWEESKLIECIADGGSISYGIVQPGDDFPNGVPVVRPIDLTGGKYIKRDYLKIVDPAISNSYKRTILLGNEILMCVRGTTGVIRMADISLKDANVTRGITPLRIKDSINITYMYEYLKRQKAQEFIKFYTKGTTLKQINMADLRNLPVLLPPLELQQQFAAKVEAIEAQKAEIEATIKELQTLLDSRMDYWFN